MRTSFLLSIAALALLAGCDSTQNRATNSSSTPTTAARPTYDSAASPSGAGDGDTAPANSSTTRGSGDRLAPASTDRPGTAGPSTAEPDNTAVNERDRERNTKTPNDQNENQRDVNITADIRKEVLATKDMSINARNVKIITADGKVTLRGPVNSEDEKTSIDKIARNVAGKDNVTNEIEVKSDK